jgi:hypothetical protein
MTIDELDKYINDKIDKEGKFLIFTYYEIRVKMNLTKEEAMVVIDLIKRKLTNNNYSVLFPGDIYYKNSQQVRVKENELLVAIKE